MKNRSVFRRVGKARGRIRFDKHIFPLELEEIAKRRERIAAQGGYGSQGRGEITGEGDLLESAQRFPSTAVLEARTSRLQRRVDRWSKGSFLKKSAAFVAQSFASFGPFLKRKIYGEEWAPPLTRFQGVEPSTRHGLIGLALSGGGIRSATFNLGVVQALAERGIFRRVDYVSTVSGGGYLGSCLSSLLNRESERFPLDHREWGKERAALRHLRNNSNYLAPRGLIDLIRIPALLLRGIVIHLAVLLPYMVLAVWLTYLRWGDELRKATKADEFFTYTAWCAGVFLFWCLISPVLQWQWPVISDWLLPRLRQGLADKKGLLGQKGIRRLVMRVSRPFLDGGIATRRWYEGTFGFLLLLTLGLAVVEMLPTALSYYDYYLYGKGRGTDLSAVLKAARDSWWYAAAGSLLAFMSAGSASANVSKLRGKLTLIALGLLGPIMLLGIYLWLGEWCVFGHAPAFVRDFVPGVDLGGLNRWPIKGTGGPGAGWWPFTLVVALLGVYTMCYVDVNTTSLHAFYRDRLSKAYLFQVDDADCVEPNDCQKLSKLNDAHVAPYHLVNGALNLQGNNDPDLRGRMADFFLFSKHFVGCERTGYCPTPLMEQVHRRLDLGTAMAISGAAAAPNMGSTTIKPLTFVMTLLNVRLGYWLPNPWRVETRSRGVRLKAGVGPVYLLRELVGLLDEASSHVNVSDGGHIENLGIYELLRRRCKFVVASDAEADSKLTFGSLATLMRYASIDLGIRIEIDLDDVRKREDGLSRRQCALGKIHYPPKPGELEGETGYLLYIKSSLSGSEPETIREYRSRNVDFPHETTADQFFNESQFEAYRSLGHQVGLNLFRRTEPYEVGEWFKELEVSLRPFFPKEDAFVDLQRQLSSIEEGLADPDLATYAYQIYPEIDPNRGRQGLHFADSVDPTADVEVRAPLDLSCEHEQGEASDERFRKVFHFANRQMQFMENAFLTLDLDRLKNREHQINRGWMNLFRRWAQAPYFRRAWAVSVSTYSIGFQRFCEEALKLNSELWCEPRGWRHLTRREQQYLVDWKLDHLVREERPLSDAELARRPFQIWRFDLCVDLGSERTSLERAQNRRNGALDVLEQWFPVGFVLLGFRPSPEEPKEIELLFCRVRDFYRNTDLFEQMLDRLHEALRSKFPNVKLSVLVPEGHEDVTRRFAYLFERNQFHLPSGPRKLPRADRKAS